MRTISKMSEKKMKNLIKIYSTNSTEIDDIMNRSFDPLIVIRYSFIRVVMDKHIYFGGWF
jgi:hypothetical protein